MLVRMWNVRNSFIAVENAKWYIYFGRQWTFSYKTKPNSYHMMQQSCFILLGIHPKELKTYVHKKTCTQMFKIAALFIITKTWKPPRKMSFSK